MTKRADRQTPYPRRLLLQTEALTPSRRRRLCPPPHARSAEPIPHAAHHPYGCPASHPREYGGAPTGAFETIQAVFIPTDGATCIPST
jgi:hypothetical protein